MRLALPCLVLVISAGSAGAQTLDDCSQGLFRLREFPMSVVSRAAQAESKDPANTVVGNTFAKCESGTKRVFVCGQFARRSSTGYIDQQRRFFGVYNSGNGRFELTAVDSYADSACMAKIYTK